MPLNKETNQDWRLICQSAKGLVDPKFYEFGGYTNDK